MKRVFVRDSMPAGSRKRSGDSGWALAWGRESPASPPRYLAMTFRLAPLVALVMAYGCGSGHSNPSERIRASGEAFGTTWSVVFVPSRPGSPPSHEEIERTVQGALERVDALMSTFRPDSQLVRFNDASSTEPFLFDAEARMVIGQALRFARETGGAFDPTVAPLVRAWGFGAGASEQDPSPEEIEHARARVGWDLVEWNAAGALVRRVPKVELDLSGIAKGYGVDAVFHDLSLLRPGGLLVEIGGDLRVMGTRQDGRSWRLGIESPAGGLDTTVEMTHGALATSGDYRQRRGEGDHRRTHIVDPRAGITAPIEVASASVMAPTALEADAVATALVVLGREEAMSFVEERPWLEAMLLCRKAGVESELDVHHTSGWPKGEKSGPFN